MRVIRHARQTALRGPSLNLRIQCPILRQLRHVALFLVTVACQRAAPAEEKVAARVRCEPATLAAVQDVRLLRGTVVTAPDDDVVVASQVAGRLEAVLVREGETVAENAIIGRVATQPLADALAQAQAHLQQAQATAQNANITYARAQQLYARGIVPRQQVDDTSTHEREALAAASAAMAAVRAASHNLERANVRTSTDGVVLRVLRRPGELVDGTPATPVAEIADPNDLEFLASAQPVDFIALRTGQRGEAKFDALPQASFPLEVRSVAPVVDTATGVGSVRLMMLSSAVHPPLGLYGTAAVQVGGQRQAVVVAPGALRNAWAGGSEVVVCQDGKAVVRQVRIGTRADKQVEIVSGVKAGDQVVVDNVVGLVDGAPLDAQP